jgi:hypothetical protein
VLSVSGQRLVSGQRGVPSTSLSEMPVFSQPGREGIRQSDEIITLDLTRAVGIDSLGLGLAGPEAHYTIQSSLDLISWEDLMVVTNLPPTSLPSLDPRAAAHLFYRANANTH